MTNKKLIETIEQLQQEVMLLKNKVTLLEKKTDLKQIIIDTDNYRSRRNRSQGIVAL